MNNDSIKKSSSVTYMGISAIVIDVKGCMYHIITEDGEILQVYEREIKCR